MTDLNQLNLESLPNVDNRLIPQIKKYFERVMELHGKPLDYRIETIYNELINGDLKFLVGNNDKNSVDYSEDLKNSYGSYAGVYCHNGTLREHDGIATIIVNEDYVYKINEIFPDDVFHVISHEMEHYISNRFNNNEINVLTFDSIIGEPATEIGNLYNLLSGDEEKILEHIFQKDKKYRVAYEAGVKLLISCNHAAGHSIKEIVEANRNNDFDYFCSIIPEKYIKIISLLYDDFFEGKCIGEIGNQPARVFYDAIEQLKNHMWENYEEYPNMSETISNQMLSIFEGYESIIKEKETISELLGINVIFDIDDLDEETFEKIKNEFIAKFPNTTSDEVEYSIFFFFLRMYPQSIKGNAIMSLYSGYIKYIESLEATKNSEQGDTLVRNNFEEFLDLYKYKEGIPTTGRIVPKQEIIIRDTKTGKIKCFRNGFEILEDDRYSILLDEKDEKYGDFLNVIGKTIDEDEWKKIQELLLSQKRNEYVKQDEIVKQVEFFKKALKVYCGLQKEELTEKEQEFLELFYKIEFELGYEEDEIEEKSGMVALARNALSGINYASSTSVKKVDEKYENRTELSNKEGERI